MKRVVWFCIKREIILNQAVLKKRDAVDDDCGEAELLGDLIICRSIGASRLWEHPETINRNTRPKTRPMYKVRIQQMCC